MALIIQWLIYYFWAFVIAIGVISCLAVCIKIWLEFPDRTVSDVVDFLVPIDLDRLESLLDPALEWSLRHALTPAEFQRLQRKRVHLYLEFLYRMKHNAKILVQLGNREAEGHNKDLILLAQDLQQQSVAVHMYALLASIKLRLWMLMRINAWHLLPTPRLCDFRDVSGISCLQSYYGLRNAAGAFFVKANPKLVGDLLDRL